MSKTLNIWRGLPGSGKSFLAEQAGGPVYEADQFFMEDGEYRFNPKKLKDAHAWCKDAVEEALMFLKPVVNVANTFTQHWEMEDYIDLAKSHGYEVQINSVRGDWGNQHGVPAEALKRMADRWQDYDGETIVDNSK